MSPPAVALVILMVATALAAAVFFVATLGEIFGAGAFSGLTQLVVIVWNLIGAAMIATMFWFGIREALRSA